MMTGLFSLRENEIFQTLKALSDSSFVMIGGYAVNTYSLPRFSVDCDIVVKNNNQLKQIENLLLKKGYSKKLINKKAQYSSDFQRYEKKIENNFKVSIDIIINEVIDRLTGVKFKAGWIFENSEMRVLKGKTMTKELKLRIINIDALIVMKIISCRATDIRDVFMMLPHAINKEWIKSEVNLRYNLKERISKIIEKVNSKQFKDGLSGVYGNFDQTIFEKHKKAILMLNEGI